MSRRNRPKGRSTQNLTMQQLAQISNISYQLNAPTRRKFAKDINPNLVYEGKHSNKHIAVIRDRRNNNIYVSHRGTKLSASDLMGSLADLWADTFIVGGKEKTHKRFKEANEHYKKLREEFPDANIIMSSHSLGGAISRHIVGNNPDDDKLSVHAFNPGSSVGHVLDKILPKKRHKKKNNIHVYHGTTNKLNLPDIISVIGNYGEDNVHIIQSEGSNAHSLKNFINYEGEEHNL